MVLDFRQFSMVNSMVSLASFQFSMEKLPVTLPPGLGSLIMMFNVSRVLADKVDVKFLDKVCVCPSRVVIINSSCGVAAEGNNMTVALLMDVPSAEATRSNLTVLLIFSGSAV